MKVILFDIDGTLLNPHGAGKRAMLGALQAVISPAILLEGIPFAGRTDRQILGDALSLNGWADRERLEEVLEILPIYMQKEVARGGVVLLPGVPALLAALSQKDHLILGLLTGNTRATAPLKLAAVGIDPDLFRFGAFGDEAVSRNDLPPLALHRARKFTGLPLAKTDFTVVGDTPADIACAHTNGMRAVAVATGWHSSAELAAHNPDHLLQDFSNLGETLNAL